MTKKRKGIFKKIIGWLHLWLGLASGLVIVIISITGCLFVFQKEFSELKYENVFFIPRGETGILPLQQLQEIAQQALGKNQPVNDITVWKDPKRAWEFMAYKENDTALTYFGVMEYYRSAFLNPYTGQVTGIRNYKTDFFQIVKYLHWSLLLNDRYGQPIVGWSTVIFVVMLITGLVLWWPRKWNRDARKRSFSIRWKGRFRRVNYDLHNVPGFYFYIPALILALTELVYAFQWFQTLVHAAASGTTAYAEQPTAKSLDPGTAINDPTTVAWHVAEKKNPAYQRMNITTAKEADGVISIYSYKDNETYYNYQEMHFDRYNGNLIWQQHWDQKNPGERLIGMNYDIHVGAIGGLAGRSLLSWRPWFLPVFPLPDSISGGTRKKRDHIFLTGLQI